MISLSQDAPTDGWVLPPRSTAPAIATTTTVAATIPTTQPSRNPALVRAAWGANSTRITATIDIGLIATPTASGIRSPMTAPMAPPRGTYPGGLTLTPPRAGPGGIAP